MPCTLSNVSIENLKENIQHEKLTLATTTIEYELEVQIWFFKLFDKIQIIFLLHESRQTFIDLAFHNLLVVSVFLFCFFLSLAILIERNISSFKSREPILSYIKAYNITREN